MARGDILKRHVGHQRVEKIQPALTIRGNRLEKSIQFGRPVVPASLTVLISELTPPREVPPVPENRR